MIPNDIKFRTMKLASGGTDVEGSIIFRYITNISEYTQVSSQLPQLEAATKNAIATAIKHGIFEWLKEYAPGELDSYYQIRLREEADGYYKSR